MLILIQRVAFLSTVIVHFSSPQIIPEDARPDVGRLLCDSTGPASHVAPSILAQGPCFRKHLLPWTPSPEGEPALHQSCDPFTCTKQVSND